MSSQKKDLDHALNKPKQGDTFEQKVFKDVTSEVYFLYIYMMFTITVSSGMWTQIAVLAHNCSGYDQLVQWNEVSFLFCAAVTDGC